MTRRSPTIDIVIADDHPIFRDGLRKLLEDEEGFRVVGEAADGEEAVKLARELEPDLLLLDVAMPRCSGIEALRQLAAFELRVRPILLTVAVEEKDLMEALRLGARGVVLKESATELLFRAIRAVMAGQHWIGRTTVSDLVRYFRERAASAALSSQPRPGLRLTTRERQVVSSVAAGRSNKEIAAQFSLSEDTVKHHLTRIYDKVGVSTRLELAVFAIQSGLANGAER